MRAKASLVSTLDSVARIAANERAFPASVPPIPPTSQFSSSCLARNALGNFLREAVRRARNASANGLAENQNVGIEILRPRIAAGPRADGMRFVDDEQGAMLAREFAQGLVISRLRMHDANIRHRRLGQHARHIARRQRPFQRVNIVKLDNLGGHRRIDRRPNVPRPRPSLAVRIRA